MKILLLNPPRVKGCPVVREDGFEHRDFDSVYPPLSLLHSYSVIDEKDHEVFLFDANGMDKSIRETLRLAKSVSPDIILGRFAFDSMKEDMEMLTMAKEATDSILAVRCKIVSETAWLREDVMSRFRTIDIFMDSDIEDVACELASVVNKGCSLSKVKGITFRVGKKTATTEKACKRTTGTYPSYEALRDLKPYGTSSMRKDFGIFLSGAGCPFSCSFCGYRKSPYKPLDLRITIDALEKASGMGMKRMCFFDPVFSLDKKRTERLCSGIIDRGLKLEWSCQTRTDMISRELLKIMKKAGCVSISYGIESGSQRVLNLTGKGTNIAQTEKAAKLTMMSGMRAYLNAMIGLPGETKESLAMTGRLVKKIKPDYCQFCYTVPFPNTPLYRHFRERDEITSYDWSRYNPLEEPVISTKSLPASEMKRQRDSLYREMFTSPRFMAKNIMGSSRTNMASRARGYAERVIGFRPGKGLR